MQFINVQEVTFTKRARIKGSNVTEWAVDLDGAPFGLIRKFDNTATESHPYTAIANDGQFAHKDCLRGAMDFMRGLM